MISTLAAFALLLSAVPHNVAASPSIPRATNIETGTAIHTQLAGIEEGLPVLAAPATSEAPYASMRLFLRDEDITYSPNVCGFVSGSIDAAITCKAAERTCTPIGTWFRCCEGTDSAGCEGPIPTACINFVDGGSTGCEGVGASTTCCSDDSRAYCESLVMTSDGATVSNVVCGGRDRGTRWLPLLATATDDPRLDSSSSPSGSSSESTTSSTSSADESSASSASGDDTANSGGDSGGDFTSEVTGPGVIETAAPGTGEDEDNKPVGAIVGGVVGGVGGVSLLLVGMWFLRKRQYNREGRSPTVSRSDAPGMRGPSPVYLPPQTLPELQPDNVTADSRPETAPTSPTAQSQRYYYGGMPKATGEDPPPARWNHPGSPETSESYGMGRGF